MRPSTYFTTAVLATIVPGTLSSSAHNDTPPSGGQYKLVDDLSYKNFFDGFDFFSGPDPTKGFVQYQNMQDAVEQQLVGYLEDTQSIFMGVDYKGKDANGRASVRLESKKTWSEGLLIADIRHMPSSECGSWPAYWLLGSGKEPGSGKEIEWPASGEVDILEGVNDYENNVVTLHTSTGCVVDNKTLPAPGTGEADGGEASFSGFLTTDDCDVAASGQGKNVGCSIKAPIRMPGIQTGSDPDEEAILPSYGTEFNKAGGGVYATEWTSSGISVWFFPRNSLAYSTHFGNTTAGSDSALDPSSTFGTPLAHFSGSGCDFTKRFQNMRVIFDTTFCGEWAGKEWDKSCAAKTGVDTCEAYVRDNPEAFMEAYWEVAGLQWFQRTDGSEQKEKRTPVIPLSSFVKAKGRPYRW